MKCGYIRQTWDCGNTREVEEKHTGRHRLQEKRNKRCRMAYKSYASESYYEGRYEGTLIPEDDQKKALIQASRHIDALTFNRIVGRGFSNLTEYQQEIIKEVVCQQAEFETENADMIASVLSSYSINGVSMQFGSAWNVFTDKGVAMRRDTYALLCQTGLCCRLAR